jgi:hypothetical protein
VFYNSSAARIVSDASHIEFDRIFCGQYWDDFAIASLLGAQEKQSISVLMLGLALGGGIRPILANGRVSRIVAIDVDGDAAGECIRLYKGNFPLIKFEVIVSDALTYLQGALEKFDVIFVDLYTNESYAESMFDRELYSNLRACLNDGGHVAFNAFGLPSHLGPFSGATPQAYLAALLNESWDSIFLVPHRRNSTLIVGADIVGLPTPEPSADLTTGDRVALRLLRFRLQFAQRVQVEKPDWDNSQALFYSIDAEMRRRWVPLMPELSSIFNRNIQRTSDLATLLSDVPLCRSVQDQLWADNHPLVTMLPILIAGEMNRAPIDARWLPQWATWQMNNYKGPPDHVMVGVILPQALSVLNNSCFQASGEVMEFDTALTSLCG